MIKENTLVAHGIMVIVIGNGPSDLSYLTRLFEFHITWERYSTCHPQLLVNLMATSLGKEKLNSDQLYSA